MLNHFKVAISVFAFAFTFVSVNVTHAEEVSVDIISNGTSINEAITNGLVQAIQQVTGVSISAAVIVNSNMHTQVLGSRERVLLDDKLQKNISQDINGVVKEYRVTSSSTQPNSIIEVQMTVVIDKYSEAGLSSDSRRKLAVMPFADSNGRVTQQGITLQTNLVANFVKTRRFAVLDRSNSAAYEREMSLIVNRNTPISDQARLGKVLSADYVITGTIRLPQTTVTEQNIPLTGERFATANTINGRVDFSLMEVATRQVKFAGHFEVSGNLDNVAQRISSAVVGAIYPLKVIDFSDPKDLIINQGGDGIKKGQKYTAFVLGKELFDPYTKESLGRREREIGIVEITRVLDKITHAKLLRGNLPTDSDSEIVLRMHSPQSQSTSKPVSNDINQGNNEAPIIRLPFDKK